jgi:hypothetical protein
MNAATLILTLALAQVPAVPGADEVAMAKKLIAENISASERADLLLHQNHPDDVDCVLQQSFWGDVSPTEKNKMSLGLFLMQRQIGTTWCEADTLSVLVRHEDSKVWLRAGPSADTGWVPIGEVASSDPIKSPLRSCFKKNKVPTGDPCKKPTVQSLAVKSMPGAIGERKVEFELVSSISGPAYLGRHGVSAWLLSKLDDLESSKIGSDEDTEGMQLPRSSELRWRESTWIEGNPLPELQLDYLPQFEAFPPKAPTSSQELNGQNTARRAVDGQDKKPARECKPCKDAKVFAPRAKTDNKGFTWSWVGLPHAQVDEHKSSRVTDRCGCVGDDREFSVNLANDNFEIVQSGQQYTRSFKSGDPLIFIDPGAFTQSALAANIFVHGAEGLEAFAKVFEWIPELVHGVKFYQTAHPGDDCVGFRSGLREIFLPSTCPDRDAFLPKGYCGDVILHELAHEVMGSLVDLATHNRSRKVRDQVLDEALADFFAMILRQEPLDPDEFGTNCQNDRRNLRFDSGHVGQSALVGALHEADDLAVMGRLSAVSVLFANHGWREFVAELVDFAADKAKLDKELIRDICASVYDGTKVCETKHCSALTGRGSCVEFAGAARENDQLVARGIFHPTSECQGVSFEIGQSKAGKRKVPTAALSPKDPQVLGTLSLPDLSSSFELSLKPKCESLRESTLTLNGLPADSEVWSFDALGWSASHLDSAGFLAVAVDPLELVKNVGDTPWDVSKVMDLRVLPGFSISETGSLEGWTPEGRPFNAAVQGNGWNAPVFGQPADFSRKFSHSLVGPGIPLGLSGPRTEILEIDSMSITLADWGGGEPVVVKRFWQQEIQPDAVKVGLSSAGVTVLEVVEKFPAAYRLYQIRGGVVEPYKDRDLVAIGNESPGLTLWENGQKIAELKIARSYCKAPPFLSFVGKQVFALTCDGTLVEGASNPEGVYELGYMREDMGIVPPDPTIRPLQSGDLNGDGRDELVVGPLRTRQEGRIVDAIFVETIMGEAVRTEPIVSFYETVGSPYVGNVDNDKCKEIVLATARTLDTWKFGCGSSQ